MTLFLNSNDVTADQIYTNNVVAENRVVDKAHEMKLVHGNESALAISLRRPGYHSAPHIHDFEQLNYIAEGEMWFFVDDRGYHMRKGDILRIPRNAIHWSWVKTDEPCLCYEVFSPPPPLTESSSRTAVGLFDDGETPAVGQSMGAYYIDPEHHGLNVEEIESRPPVNRVAAHEAAS